MAFDFIPFNYITRAVGAEYRIAGIISIGFAVVSYFADHLVAVVARLIALKTASEPAVAVGVLHNVSGVVVHC